jgi:hypothetical protein
MIEHTFDFGRGWVMALCPGRLYEAADGAACDRGEWCLVASFRGVDEEAFRDAHDHHD